MGRSGGEEYAVKIVLSNKKVGAKRMLPAFVFEYRSQPKRIHGFTIVELLIVIVVIAILAAITVVVFNGIQSRAKVTASQSSALNAARKIAAQYIMDGNTYPASLADVGITDSDGATYQYTASSIGTGFCVTATTKGASGNAGGVGSTTNQPASGPCPGHVGVAPVKLDDGSACPAGYIVVPGNSTFNTKTFCAMKYEAKNVSSIATSQASSTPWVSITRKQQPLLLLPVPVAAVT